MNDRKELARIFDGVGAELGVAAGAYSKVILDAGRATRLYSIDRWQDHHSAREYLRACERLSRYRRSVVLRATFAEAAPLFPDEFFDFLYIDGYAEGGQEGGRTLQQWWPKLKPGGIFSGHDYHPNYPETMRAVDAFCASRGLPLSTTSSRKERPSWWTFKPPKIPLS